MHRYPDTHMHKLHIPPLSAPESHWCYEIQAEASNHTCQGKHSQPWDRPFCVVGAVQVKMETQGGWEE